MLLVPDVGLVAEHGAQCDGFVFSGGDDPVMEPFGVQTDQRVTPVNPVRQRYETALLRLLKEKRPEQPVLGVCLGMQMMALVDGGTLDQYIPDSMPIEAHWDSTHEIDSAGASLPAQLRDMLQHDAFPSGTVHSRHKQAVINTGKLVAVASAKDGVIEAVASPSRPFYLGVQWHPERTTNDELGLHLFCALTRACGTRVSAIGAN